MTELHFIGKMKPSEGRVLLPNAIGDQMYVKKQVYNPDNDTTTWYLATWEENNG